MTQPVRPSYHEQAKHLLSRLKGYNYRQAWYHEDVQLVYLILLEWDHQVTTLEQRCKRTQAQLNDLRAYKGSDWAWLKSPFRTFARYLAFLIGRREHPVL